MRRSRQNLLAQFCDDRRGNIAILFAVTLTLMVGFAGAGIDYSRSLGAQATLQEAADAGLLAAARLKALKPLSTAADLKAAARKVFDLQIASQKGVAVNDFDVNYDPSTKLFTIDVDADLPTLLLRAAGRDAINVGVNSEAVLGDLPNLEIALALDNTGSMGKNGKIEALRGAATDLVTTLIDAGGSKVRFSLVPFAQYVNVDAANAGESWLDNPGAGFAGCVGSRPAPLNEKDDQYATDPVPGLVGVDCPAPIMTLSNNKTAITDAIKVMGADGYTYIPAGLAWAWRTLSSQAPFIEGAPTSDVTSKKVVKYVVLMTDGANTRAPSFPSPTHESPIRTIADEITADLCDAVKLDKIVIFTVAFDVNDAVTKSMLEDCATTPDNFFTPDNPEELKRDFLEIATAVQSISLSR